MLTAVSAWVRKEGQNTISPDNLFHCLLVSSSLGELMIYGWQRTGAAGSVDWFGVGGNPRGLLCTSALSFIFLPLFLSNPILHFSLHPFAGVSFHQLLKNQYSLFFLFLSQTGTHKPVFSCYPSSITHSPFQITSCSKAPVTAEYLLEAATAAFSRAVYFSMHELITSPCGFLKGCQDKAKYRL